MEQIKLIEMAGLILASTGLWRFLEFVVTHKMQRKTSTQKLLLGLAFKDIVETCEKHLANGEIDTDEYKELNHYLFEPYQKMGGDGTAARLIAEVEKLPIKKARLNADKLP